MTNERIGVRIMNNRIIRILISMLIISVICISAERFNSFAEKDNTVYTEGTLYYTVDNDSITITGCFGRDAEVTVPAMIAGTPVNTIARGAFTENASVKTLKLPDTISRVEPGAIGEGIRVIYNANTDHPQDNPTELILKNSGTEPEESTAAETETTEPVTTEPVTTEPVTTEAVTTEAVTTEAVTTEAETSAGENVGEVDIDIDDTTETTDEPETDTAADSGTETEPLTTDAVTEPGNDTTGTGSSVTTEPVDGTDGEQSGEKRGNKTALWLIPCSAAVIAAGGAIAYGAVKKKKSE